MAHVDERGAMEAWKAVEEAGRRQGLSAYAISKSMGKTQGYIANAKARGTSPTAATLEGAARACGYRLCIVPADELPDSAIEIER